MNDPQETQSTAGGRSARESCSCHEIADMVRQFLGISSAAQQHLTNSRVELLKAVREMLTARIEHLSSHEQKGTKVAVE